MSYIRIIEGFSGVAKMTVEGNTISGVDADGNEIFRHEYTAMDVENENGFLFYQTADADAGQFTYFAFVVKTGGFASNQFIPYLQKQGSDFRGIIIKSFPIINLCIVKIVRGKTVLQIFLYVIFKQQN